MAAYLSLNDSLVPEVKIPHYDVNTADKEGAPGGTPYVKHVEIR